ncbi:phosphoglucosamine mutase [Novispirillum sp. DQ9]|uniref:phosphoglucosamine mutase n=1 Tax=Novispirillum sp. DQ9 TaxID=3398612 RepID=UPI003C7A6FC0
MTRKYFGTDGVRGTANTEPMTAQTALRIGMAAGRYFTNGDHRHTVVIAKDTRLSGYMIEPALTAGFVSMGMDVILCGPLPTPAVAMLTRSMRADLGVMISASHNPFQDNGIKLFGPDGFKLSDEVEHEIEAMMDSDGGGGLEEGLAAPARLGRARRIDDASGRYIEAAKQAFPRRMTLEGLKVVIDCANGAAYKTAPTVLWELGANVVKVGVTPDGMNINKDCGSLHTQLLRETVLMHGADIGIALDGDADRVVLCDEKGAVIDGDQVLGLIGRSWKERGTLTGGGVVATVMSNMGLEKYLQGHGLDLIRTNVGDRYVVERMRADGYNLGGEQSGHIVLGGHATTGDGLVAALQVLAEMVSRGDAASKVLRVFDPFPQLLRNIRVADKALADSLLGADSVARAVEQGIARFAGSGRVLLRKSGTEPLIRVMAEGENKALVDDVVAEICDTIERAAAEAH